MKCSSQGYACPKHPPVPGARWTILSASSGVFQNTCPALDCLNLILLQVDFSPTSCSTTLQRTGQQLTTEEFGQPAWLSVHGQPCSSFIRLCRVSLPRDLSKSILFQCALCNAMHCISSAHHYSRYVVRYGKHMIT